MSNALMFDFVTPFSPMLLSTQMPAGAVHRLNEAIDHIVSENERVKSRDVSSTLAGNIGRELHITDIISKDKELENFLIWSARIFVTKSSNMFLGQSFGQTNQPSESRNQNC